MLVLKPLRDKLGLTRIKLALCGGSTMAPDVFRLFHAIGGAVAQYLRHDGDRLLTLHQATATTSKPSGIGWLRIPNPAHCWNGRCRSRENC